MDGPTACARGMCLGHPQFRLSAHLRSFWQLACRIRPDLRPAGPSFHKAACIVGCSDLIAEGIDEGSSHPHLRYEYASKVTHIMTAGTGAAFDAASHSGRLLPGRPEQDCYRAADDAPLELGVKLPARSWAIVCRSRSEPEGRTLNVPGPSGMSAKARRVVQSITHGEGRATWPVCLR
jgi:hypothetical protein